VLSLYSILFPLLPPDVSLRLTRHESSKCVGEKLDLILPRDADFQDTF
jgi:hypothetical protein